MEVEKIDRINALAHKAKVWGLLKKRKKKENCCARNILHLSA